MYNMSGASTIDRPLLEPMSRANELRLPEQPVAMVVTSGGRKLSIGDPIDAIKVREIKL